MLKARAALDKLRGNPEVDAYFETEKTEVKPKPQTLDDQFYIQRLNQNLKAMEEQQKHFQSISTPSEFVMNSAVHSHLSIPGNASIDEALRQKSRKFLMGHREIPAVGAFLKVVESKVKE